MSKENRYRFAWLVATTDPKVQASDVDQDLVFLARQALDKNWRRRSALTLDDFLAVSNIQQVHALEALGLSANRPRVHQTTDHDLAARLGRVIGIARSLESTVSERLRNDGVTVEHFLEAGADDNTKLLRFCWNAPASTN